MKITNILIQQTDNLTKISWFAGGIECYFENEGKTDPIDVMEWIMSMPEEDQREHYVQKQDWFELLDAVMAHGKKINMIS